MDDRCEEVKLLGVFRSVQIERVDQFSRNLLPSGKPLRDGEPRYRITQLGQGGPAIMVSPGDVHLMMAVLKADAEEGDRQRLFALEVEGIQKRYANR